MADKTESFVQCIRDIFHNIHQDATIFNPKWVKKNGIHYHSNNCDVITGIDGVDPLFSRIIDFFVISGDLLMLHVQACQTHYYNEHCHSYVIYDLPNMFIICVDDLCSPFVLHSHKLFDGSMETYITLNTFSLNFCVLKK